MTGEWAVWSDFNTEQRARPCTAPSSCRGIPTIILLLIAFGSAIAAGIPLLLALAGIAVGFAALHLLGDTTPLSVWAMNFSMMIGLAVGIDYSLFIVSRYREEREDGNDALDAIANTLTTAGKAVFLSALTVVLSLAAVFVVPVMVFRSMALGMILVGRRRGPGRAAPCCPPCWSRLGDRVLVVRNHQDPDRAAEGRWARWTGHALRHPGRTLVAGLALLLLLAAPAIGMRLGMPGARVVDQGRSSRDGYDMIVASPSGPAPPRRCSSPSPPTTPRPVVAAGPRRHRTSSTPRSWPNPRPPAAPSSASPRPPPVDAAATSDLVAPTARHHRRPGPRRPRRWTRRPEPRPHRGAHRRGPTGHRPHHGRGLRAAARGVPQPHHRPVVDRC